MTTGFLKRVLMETSGRERTWKINDEGPLESLRTREPLCTGWPVLMMDEATAVARDVRHMQ